MKCDLVKEGKKNKPHLSLHKLVPVVVGESAAETQNKSDVRGRFWLRAETITVRVLEEAGQQQAHASIDLVM